MVDKDLRAQHVVIIQLVGVVAALISTFSYTALITPPQEFSSDCTELCASSVQSIALAAQAALKTCQLVDPGIDSVIVDDQNNVSIPFNTNYCITQSVNINNGFTDTGAVSISYWILYFAAFNALALFSSLSCTFLSVFLLSTTGVNDDLTSILTLLLSLLTVAICSAMAAFVLMHFIVFWVVSDKNTHALVGVILTVGITFSFFSIASTLFYRHKFKLPSPVAVPASLPADPNSSLLEEVKSMN